MRLYRFSTTHSGREPVPFPQGWYDRLAKAFDSYLKPHTPEEINSGNTLYELYKAWRDECKVGFNRVDLEKLMKWLGEHG